MATFFDLPVIQVSTQKVQADESVRVEMTFSKEAYEKVKRAQELMSHAVPHKDLALFLEYLSEKVIRQKTKESKAEIQTLKSTATVAVKILTTSAKRVVHGTHMCCQYKDPVSGRICNSKWFLQIDHKQSRWAGGQHDIENLQVLCGQHNRLKYRHETGVKLR